MRRSLPFRMGGGGGAVGAPQPLFDAAFVLNLERRTDRWSHASHQIQKSKIAQFVSGGTVERVEGVEGTTLDMAALVRNGVLTKQGYERLQLPTEQKLFGMDLTVGAVGCALGHRKIWEMVVQRGCKRALILEDDVEFSPKLHRTLRERWAKVPQDWGIVYFGGLDLLSRGKPPRPFIDEGIRLAYNGHRELTAYVVNAKSAARCLELSVPMTWQVDTHICNQLAHDAKAKDDYICDPKSYVFQPALAIQVTSFGTDVQKVPAENPAMEDAARRMREFVGGGTSVR